jgi:hypothetical protein
MAKKNINNGLSIDFDIETNETAQEQKPVTVLGITFDSDDERRRYFREQLRAKLPELRKIEGFPIGSDDDIINLSDPPYYTACPNPWLNEFIAEWEEEKRQLEADGKRQPNIVVNEPYAADVSEGKNNPIYTAHSYHTKVPHTAIMRYILHYTQPGDVILDGFCGTGMTGVAAQLCDDSNEVKALNMPNAVPGARHAICSDLSVIASHIAAGYNMPFSTKQFKDKAFGIIQQVEDELGYLYETSKNYHIYSSIWSDIFVCNSCNSEFPIWNLIINENKKEFIDEFNCPNCGVRCTKKTMSKAVETYYDEFAKETIQHIKKKLIRSYYNLPGGKSSTDDIDELNDDDNCVVPKTINYRIGLFPQGDKTKDLIKNSHIKYVHQLYTKRAFIFLSRLYELVKDDVHLLSWFTSVLLSTTNLNRFRFSGTGLNSGTFYLPSLSWEFTPKDSLERKLKAYMASNYLGRGNSVVHDCSATDIHTIDNESIDYIFIDPPFGANIMYSELNSIWEYWLGVKTNNHSEAIINSSQHKTITEYQSLMDGSFKEFYRVLKPGKWMTIEFSNTSASVWNSLQTALQNTGFIISNVAALDKQQGSFNAVTSTTAVKQDLIISCFKPTESLLTHLKDGTPETNVWEFINELLLHVNPKNVNNGYATTIVERTPKILYDKLIAFYVQNGFEVPLSAVEFQAGLRERFIERDGMFFTASQAAKYDEMRKNTAGFQTTMFFVDSEQGGIAWLKNELATPQTYQDIFPKWSKATNGVRKGDILPELMQILHENFIKEPDGRWRKPNLQDDVDLEALRTKALLREFNVYVEAARKPKGKISEARVEALRAGFMQCYKDKDFATIIAVGDRIPQNLLNEDGPLLQMYEIALSHV